MGLEIGEGAVGARERFGGAEENTVDTASTSARSVHVRPRAFYSNANAKLGTLGWVCLVNVCRKRGDCLKYRKRRRFEGGRRQKVMVVGLDPRQILAIDCCTAHFEAAIGIYIILERDVPEMFLETVCQASYR